MKYTVMFLAVYLFGTLATTRAATLYLARVTNMKGIPEFSIMTQEEKDQVEKQIKAESQVFSKAQLAAAKQWAEENKGKQYPGGRLVQRKLYVQQTFTNPEAADKQLTFYQDQEMRQLERKKDKDEERDKQRIEAAKKAKLESVTKRKIEDEKKKEAERESQLDQAMQMVQSKIEEILNPQPAGEAKPEAKPDAKADAKPAEEKKENK